MLIPTLLAVVTGLLAAFTGDAFAQASAREDAKADIRVIAVRPGTSSLKGSLRGRETVDYRLRAATGQDLMVTLKATNRFAFFNVLPPGGGDALFVGSTSGERYRGVMPKDGEVTVRVYLMRNAARRDERGSYTLALKLDGEADPARTGPTHYHANGRVRCAVGAAQDECAFRVLRDHGARTAEVWIEVPPSEGRPRQRVLRFAAGVVSTADGSPATAAREEDNWRVQAGDETYLIPDALILGG